MSTEQPDYYTALPIELYEYAVKVARAVNAIEKPENIEPGDLAIHWYGEPAVFLAGSEHGDHYDLTQMTRSKP